jgi:hypothetical protein
MWWEGRETETTLGSEVSRLLTFYRQRLESSAADTLVVCGVGAGPAFDGAPAEQAGAAQVWQPLILIEDRSAGAPQSLPPRFNYLQLDPGSQAAQVLAEWQPRWDTLVEPVGPIVPAVRPGDSYTGAGLATVGLPVSVQNLPVNSPGAPGFLTVAHGVGAVGSAVTITTSAGNVPAHVQFRDESAHGPVGGDDIALVVLDPPYQLVGGWVVNQGTQPAPNGPPYAARAVDLFGGRSGKVIAQVNGVLMQMGDRTWQWLDCWELGVTQPLMQRGDSGALAIDPSPTPYLFGHFVGGNVALRGTGFTHHWVQDLGQVLTRQRGLSSMIAF